MHLLGVTSATCAAVWVIAAFVALASTHGMAHHRAATAARMRAARRARFANSILLLCQSALLLVGVLLFGRSGPLSAIVSEVGQWLLAAGVVLYMLMIVVTLSLTDLPGRAQLRRFENICAVLFALSLGIFSVLGVRYTADADVPFGTAGALALMFSFFVFARPYLRGSILVLTRICLQGGRPDREATLKRLLRRFRPFPVASSVALVIGVLLL